jgi:alkylhydroperoxidase family enzyme
MRIVVELLTRLEEYEAAAVIHGALRASRTAIQPTGADAESLRTAITTVAERLGDSRFATATTRGGAMSDDEAVAYAMAAIDRRQHQESL